MYNVITAKEIHMSIILSHLHKEKKKSKENNAK